MIRIEDKYRCCGCTACFAVCPHDAIEMKEDFLGFRYPEVDEARCVDCGLCERVCVFNKTGTGADRPIECLAMRNNDVGELMSSRSGAVFPALAEAVLNVGGTVYGAAFTEDFRVTHQRASDRSSCRKFKGSKYVQSDMGNTFRQVHADLKNGIPVLFSGTPCQVAALKSYVPAKCQENLFLADIVCHGVPSPAVWKDNIEYHRRCLGGPLTQVSFRDKAMFGWTAHKETYHSDSKVVTDDMFTTLFYEHVFLRDSCHVCPYASVSRESDITLADFWGWQKALPPDFNSDDRGVSLVLVNTAKGRSLADKVVASFRSEHVGLEDCIQPNLLHPSSVGQARERFIRVYRKKGLLKAYEAVRSSRLQNRINSLYLKMRRKIRAILGL